MHCICIHPSMAQNAECGSINVAAASRTDQNHGAAICAGAGAGAARPGTVPVRSARKRGVLGEGQLQPERDKAALLDNRYPTARCSAWPRSWPTPWLAGFSSPARAWRAPSSTRPTTSSAPAASGPLAVPSLASAPSSTPPSLPPTAPSSKRWRTKRLCASSTCPAAQLPPTRASGSTSSTASSTAAGHPRKYA